MVLLPLYLPSDLDVTLKAIAIRSGRTKSDIIRELIVTGLEQKRLERDSDFAEPSSAEPVRPIAPTRTRI